MVRVLIQNQLPELRFIQGRLISFKYKSQIRKLFKNDLVHALHVELIWKSACEGSILVKYVFQLKRIVLDLFLPPRKGFWIHLFDKMLKINEAWSSRSKIKENREIRKFQEPSIAIKAKSLNNMNEICEQH